jgi:hypothetical protein
MQQLTEIVCNDPQDFMSLLRMDHPTWRGQVSENWAFRGQADSRWQLVPKAFRETTDFAYTGTSSMSSLLTVDQQRREELRALNHFLFLADRVGLPIPGDSQNLRLPDTVQTAPQSFDRWPWPSMLEVLAIAQHHGVPTRLLDFSHDPLIAAFFAAYFAWKDIQKMTHDNNDSGYFAVWAVDLSPIAAAVEAHRGRRERPSIIWVTASRAENTFLHQQDALFLLDLEADSRSPKPPSLETAILDAPQRSGLEPPPEPQMVKLLLKHNHAADILRLLWKEFYHPARLMPTYDNVVATLEYRRELCV